MAIRPIFTPCNCQFQLTCEVDIDFRWHAGLALSQKRKNIQSLHEAGRRKGIWPILEVSTKSDVGLGFRLSAFNLKVRLNDGRDIPLESAFQGSKVFESGGPFHDLYGKSGADIKKDDRLRTSGALCRFDFQGINWVLEPKTAFYDWLYIHALDGNRELVRQLSQYEGFTDIEFNPDKSINCQARSCALYISLSRRNVLDTVLSDRLYFLSLLSRDSIYQSHSLNGVQGTLYHTENATTKGKKTSNARKRVRHR